MNLQNTLAETLLTQANIPASARDHELLAADIHAVAEEDFDGMHEPAARELVRRIGGLRNLQAYMDSLRAGARS